MDELYRELLWFLFSIIMLLLGLYLIYLKLYAKNSWLYKESEGKNWLYDTDGMHTWGLIFLLVGSGIVGFINFFRYFFD